MCGFRQAFSSFTSSASMLCIYTVELIQLQLGRNSVLSYQRSDFHMNNSLSIAIHAFARRILMSISVDATLLLRNIICPANFREWPFTVEMSPSRFKNLYSVLTAFTWRLMPPAAYCRLCRWDSAWVFERSVMSSAQSASDIVFARYRLLLAFFRVKTVSFIRYIDVRST